VLNGGDIDTVIANGDQWEYSFPFGEEIASCDLHATSAGGINCLILFPITKSDGVVGTSTAETDFPFTTFHLVVESSSS
jgi:hypothetical protein